MSKIIIDKLKNGYTLLLIYHDRTNYVLNQEVRCLIISTTAIVHMSSVYEYVYI